MTIKEQIHNTYLVPVVVIENVSDALETANALLAGGVDIMEITLRTEAGLGAIEQVAKNCPNMLVGAGTVLSLDNCKKTIDMGAKFIVSPGFDETIVKWCLDNNIVVLPGCVTPTEITSAMNMGLNVFKFFPANVYGGIKAIKALSAPFKTVKFVPTGGINLENLAEFITNSVFAVGGGWLCESSAIKAKDWKSITSVCEKSVQIVKETKKY